MSSPTNNEALTRKMRKRSMSTSFKYPPLPWFGLDIGGTLTKLVYFEPQLADNEEEQSQLANIRRYLTSNVAYGETGLRDAHLELVNISLLNRMGTLHFIRFPTSSMRLFVEMAKSKNLKDLADMICATGGGAYKFEQEFKSTLDMSLLKLDELECLLQGVIFLTQHYPAECYYFEDARNSCIRKTYDFALSPVYPFLIVNIGSGVSIIAVRGPEEWKRISASSLGGATFLGLSCLLSGCESFEEALSLAEDGDSTNVDKLVRDIYGGDYEQFGLPGHLVASSFGHMMCPERRASVTPNDLAKATLVMLTNNIGSIGRLCADTENIDRILFVGNFLRTNNLSIKLLASAVEFWSDGSRKALFLEHEGYFGALGSLLELVNPESFNCAKNADLLL